MNPAPTRPLPLAFYRRPVDDVARDLVGRTLCRRVAPRQILRGRIVEVEAYRGPEDLASHARFGRTARTAPMFEAGGIAYVYLIYGMHHCLNVVCGPRDAPQAVLLRAAEPPLADRNATGPGRLCRAFDVDRTHDGASLRGPELWLEQGRPVEATAIKRTPRIGVDYADEWAKAPLRFVAAGHPAVSGPKRLR